MSNDVVWVVGEFQKQPCSWTIVGIYESKAMAMMPSSQERRFLLPITLNQPLPDMRIEWKKATKPCVN